MMEIEGQEVKKGETLYIRDAKYVVESAGDSGEQLGPGVWLINEKKRAFFLKEEFADKALSRTPYLIVPKDCGRSRSDAADTDTVRAIGKLIDRCYGTDELEHVRNMANRRAMEIAMSGVSWSWENWEKANGGRREKKKLEE